MGVLVVWFALFHVLVCRKALSMRYTEADRMLTQAADKKTMEAKKTNTLGAASTKGPRASLPGKAGVDKTKKAALAKRKTMVDKWSEDDSVVADINGGSKAVPIYVRIAQIRMERGCSEGEARRLLWADHWGAKKGDEEACAMLERPVDPVADQFSEKDEDAGGGTRASSAPNSPCSSTVAGAGIERAKSAEDVKMAGLDGQRVMATPSKFPVFAATPGSKARRHSLLYSPSFAKIKGGTPADIIKRATGGTAPFRTSPLAEMETEEHLGCMQTESSPLADGQTRFPSSSPVGVAAPTCDESFQSASESPPSSPVPGSSRLALSTSSSRSDTKDSSTSPMAAAAVGRRTSKEVCLHTDIMTKEVEKVVTVEVPGPERVVEVIKEVPVEHIVVKEVPVYVDRVVESDRVVTAVKEVPVDRIVINEVAVPVDRIVTNEVEKIVEVVKQVSVRSVVEVVKEVDSPALVDELETCKRQRDELRKERHELEQQRDQVH